jgi:hypothetical protein
MSNQTRHTRIVALEVPQTLPTRVQSHLRPFQRDQVQKQVIQPFMV